MVRSVACVLLAIVALVASQASARSIWRHADRTIVGGSRVGPWTLTMNIDDFDRMHGHSIRMHVMAGLPPDAYAVFDYLIFRWDRVTVMAATFVGHKRVEFLQTGFLMPSGSHYRTDRGVGFMTRRPHILRLYGRPTAEVFPQPLEMRMIYDDEGLAFGLDMAGRVHTMYVFRRGTAGRFWHLL